MTVLMRLAGRLMICWIFLFSSIQQLRGFEQNVTHVAASGMPIPNIAIAVSIAIQSLCGIAFLLGFRIRYAAAILFLFLIPTTLMLHRFWTSAAAQSQEISFYKNVAIMGGLLFVAASDAGAYSLDSVLESRRANKR